MSVDAPWASPTVEAHLRSIFERAFMDARDKFAATLPNLQADAIKRGMPVPTADSILPRERGAAANAAFPLLVEEVRKLVRVGKIPATEGGREFALAVLKTLGEQIPRDTDGPLRASQRAMRDVRILFGEESLPIIESATTLDQTPRRGGSMASNPKSVTIVHGRNHEARDGMLDFLRALGLEPRVWDDAIHSIGKGAPHHREVLEALFATTQAVVILLTADEQASLVESLRSAPGDERIRQQARANVWIEAGLAFGVNPDRTILVRFSNHDDLPSDFHGLDHIAFDGSKEARDRLKIRLESVGCAVMVRTSDWMRAGEASFAKAALVSQPTSAAPTAGKIAPVTSPDPPCPNCSTDTKNVYMSRLPAVMVSTFGATHTCTKCKYMATMK